MTNKSLKVCCYLVYFVLEKNQKKLKCFEMIYHLLQEETISGEPSMLGIVCGKTMHNQNIRTAHRDQLKIIKILLFIGRRIPFVFHNCVWFSNSDGNGI